MYLNDAVPSSDRGLNYGDGFFTTMLIKQGSIQLWPLHLQRIINSAKALQMPAIDLASLEQHLHAQAADSDLAVLKLVVSRGSGGRGYSIAGADKLNVIITKHAFPEHYSQWQQQGIKLGIADQKLASGGALSGYKTLNRLEQVMLKIDLDKTTFDDLVVCDLFDNVVEAVASNLFFRKGDVIYSSDLEFAGVAGVQRQAVINSTATSAYKLSLGKFNLEQLHGADEIFLSNALMQVVPVKQFQHTPLSDFSACQWYLSYFNHA